MRIGQVLGAVTLAIGIHGAVQAQESGDGMDHPKQGAFRVGPTEHWDLGVPNLDINGGLYSVSRKDALPKMQEGFVSARIQTGLGTEHFQLAAHVLFVPKAGGSPQFTTVLQVVPTDNDGWLHFAAGAGIVSGRVGSGNRVEPWAQATLGVRTPIHDLAPFVQYGAPLVDGGRPELLIGVSHPLAPYKFHLP